MGAPGLACAETRSVRSEEDRNFELRFREHAESVGRVSLGGAACPGYKKMYGPDAVEKVVPMPLVSINSILEEYLPSGPNLFSIVVEGLDLAILNTLDFDRFRPEVFCIETLVMGSKRVNFELVDFMLERGYSIRGGTFVNTIFVDDRALNAAPPRES